MESEMIIISLTVFIITISLASLGFIAYNYLNKKRLMRKYYVFFKSMWIDRERGMPDYCKDVLGLFLFELFDGQVKKTDLYHKWKDRVNNKGKFLLFL